MSEKKQRWKSTPESKELFARLCVWLGCPTEAAKRVGVPAQQAERAAAELMGKPMVKRKLTRYRKELKGQAGGMALGGLYRLATYSGLGGLRMAIRGGSLTQSELDDLDLFGVSAIKWGEKGCEVKFFDRLPALAMLCELERHRDPAAPTDFLGALRESAARIDRDEVGEPEDD
ncbi:MAG: hypothetical protein FWE32_07780 [Oscillospiraceae bacterium]|nr:hypothetical protein [Oscillospiraceae bacterium]